MSAPDPSARPSTSAAPVFDKTAPSDRDAKGRFAPNNPGGPGNPFARKTAALRKALIDAVTETDLQEIAAILLLKAKQGDLAAIKLLFGYVIGKPEKSTDPDTLDRHEWQTALGNLVSPLELETVLGTWPLDLLCAILPGLVLARRGECRQFFGDLLHAAEQRNPTPPAPSQNAANGAQPCATGGLPASVCSEPCATGGLPASVLSSEDTGGQAASGTEKQEDTKAEKTQVTGRQTADGTDTTQADPSATARAVGEEILRRAGFVVGPTRQQTGITAPGQPASTPRPALDPGSNGSHGHGNRQGPA
jgi:hypothetical protein